jgi:PTS system nitrogen regulatory IIA component
MPMLEFLDPDSVVPSLRARAKKQVLQDLAAQAVRRLPALDARDVYETLLQRERLGSTGIGDGVAIPHGKLPGLDRLFGLVARLDRSTSSPSTAARSTSPSCCSPPRARAPTT